MEIGHYLIELGGVENGYFKRNKYMSVDEAVDGGIDRHIKKLHSTDAYRSIFIYETDDIPNSKVIAPLYFDLDLEIKEDTDFKKVLRDTMLTVTFLEEELFIPRKHIELYFTGSKGFHVLVPFEVLGIEPSKDLPEIYKIIGNKVKNETIYKTIDTVIYERKRLFRLPNTINAKTSLYKVPVSFDFLHKADLQKMQDYASEPRYIERAEPAHNPKTKRAIDRILLIHKMRTKKKKHPRTIIPFQKKELLPCVKSILDEGVSEGGRNNTCAAVSSSLAQSGMDKEEATEVMLSWNTLNEPPMPDSEVIRTVQSAFQMAESGRGYGCGFFKDNGHCIGDKCKLF